MTPLWTNRAAYRPRVRPWTWENTQNRDYVAVVGVPDGKGGFEQYGWFRVQRGSQRRACGCANEAFLSARRDGHLPANAALLCVKCVRGAWTQVDGLHLTLLSQKAGSI